MQPGKLNYRPTREKKAEGGFFETLFKGRHFSFLSVSTKFGKKEVIARNNAQYFACKVLPLIITQEEVRHLNISKQNCSLNEFCNIISKSPVKLNLKVPIFSVARPISKFYENYFSSLDAYELPGGVINNNEDFQLGGVRELVEELGLNQNQILAHTILLNPCPFDSGSHVECMGIIAVLLYGNINPVNWESIRGEETKIIPYDEMISFINAAKEEKRIIEGYIEYALLLINSEMEKIRMRDTKK